MKLLSVIVPCYNEEQAIPIFYQEFGKTKEEFHKEFPETEFELIFIDDGSRIRPFPVSRSCGGRMRASTMSPFREISERKPGFTRDLSMPGEIMPLSWTSTCRIRPLFCRRCTGR